MDHVAVRHVARHQYAVATIADEQYLDHALEWFDRLPAGPYDVVLLAFDVSPEHPLLSELERRGIIVFHVRDDAPAYLEWPASTVAYLYLFSMFFKQWKSVVYLDCDTVVRGSIAPLFQRKGFCATGWYHRLHPDVTVKGVTLRGVDLLNSGVMTIETTLINEKTLPHLRDLYCSLDHTTLAENYRGGAEELSLALYFYKKKKNLPLQYNIIPNELMSQWRITPAQLYGSIYHHASGNFFPKPWEKRSPFYHQWEKKENTSQSWVQKIRFYCVLSLRVTAVTFRRIIQRAKLF